MSRKESFISAKHWVLAHCEQNCSEMKKRNDTRGSKNSIKPFQSQTYYHFHVFWIIKKILAIVIEHVELKYSQWCCNGYPLSCAFTSTNYSRIFQGQNILENLRVLAQKFHGFIFFHNLKIMLLAFRK